MWAFASGDRATPDPLETTDDVAPSLSLDADRPVYRYSVIPGGVYDADDLRDALEVDPIVAAHYKDLD
jgi:hypothetical protein